MLAEQKASAYRCSYCGCVYYQDYTWGQYSKVALGFLDDAILGEGWHSSHCT